MSILLPRRTVLGGLGGVLTAALLPQRGVAQADALNDLLDQIDPAALRNTVETLSAFPTRWTIHPAFEVVEQWMMDAFTQIGAAPLRQPFTMPIGKARNNILAGDPNSGRDIILIGAHYDSISERPERIAPGANDNASGIAAMLEIQRILTGLPLDLEIVCVAFAGEEQGLRGSHACAQIARDAGWPVRLMVNLDMLGWRPPRPDTPLIIEYDMGNATPANDARARAYGLRAAELAAAHINLPTAHSNIWASDYMPFEAQGYPAIGLFDGGTEGPHYHRSSDTAGTIDFDRLEQATRLALAIAADTAGFVE